MMPRVGDRWVSEDNDGNPRYHEVTEVAPGLGLWSEVRVTLSNTNSRGLVHLGWWYGQGFSEVEEEES